MRRRRLARKGQANDGGGYALKYVGPSKVLIKAFDIVCQPFFKNGVFLEYKRRLRSPVARSYSLQRPGDIRSTKGVIEMCSNGWHAGDVKWFKFHLAPRTYSSEYDTQRRYFAVRLYGGVYRHPGRHLKGIKYVARRIKMLHEVEFINHRWRKKVK